MTNTPHPTGRREERDGTSWVVLTRTFRATAADVWAAATDPERMQRWIGTWSGDPESGVVMFRMTAEGEDAPEERVSIDVCDPPRRLTVTTSAGDQPGASWRLDLSIEERDGTTALVFAQAMTDPDQAENVGPGWEYYLDRLVAAESGADVEVIHFDDYYPAQSSHYRGLFLD